MGGTPHRASRGWALPANVEASAQARRGGAAVAGSAPVPAAFLSTRPDTPAY